MNEQISESGRKEIDLSSVLTYELGGHPVWVSPELESIIRYDPNISQMIASTPGIVLVHANSNHGELAEQLATIGKIPSLDNLIPELANVENPITFDYSTRSLVGNGGKLEYFIDNIDEPSFPVKSSSQGLSVDYETKDIDDETTSISMNPIEVESNNIRLDGLVSYNANPVAQMPFYAVSYNQNRNPGMPWYESEKMRLEDRMNMSGGYNMNLSSRFGRMTPYSSYSGKRYS